MTFRFGLFEQHSDLLSFQGEALPNKYSILWHGRQTGRLLTDIYTQ